MSTAVSLHGAREVPAGGCMTSVIASFFVSEGLLDATLRSIG
jgi:hypothetical protein